MIKRTAGWIAEQVGGRILPQHKDTVVTGVSIDSRYIESNNLFIPFKGEHTDGHKFSRSAIEKGAAISLWQEDVPLTADIPVIIVQDTLIALQEMAKAYLKEVQPKVIGVTGSNGKTTTKDMIEAVLSPNFKVSKTIGNYNNEIGLPLTICQLEEDTEISILEMGMSGFREIALLSEIAEPDFAAITNIGESHMRDLGSREGIAKAKFEITEHLKGPLFYDGDEPLLQSLVEQYDGQTISIGFNSDNDAYIHDMKSTDTGIAFKLNDDYFEVPTLGAHNARNASIAILIGQLNGLSSEQITKNLSALKLTGMRMEKLAGVNGSTLINDAYNASPTSMKAAIDTLDQMNDVRKIIVFSDVLELGEDEAAFHASVGNYFEHKSIDMLLTTGSAAKHIHNQAKQFVDTNHFDSKETLTEYLKETLKENDVCLFKASRGMALETIIAELKK